MKLLRVIKLFQLFFIIICFGLVATSGHAAKKSIVSVHAVYEFGGSFPWMRQYQELNKKMSDALMKIPNDALRTEAGKWILLFAKELGAAQIVDTLKEEVIKKLSDFLDETIDLLDKQQVLDKKKAEKEELIKIYQKDDRFLDKKNGEEEQLIKMYQKDDQWYLFCVVKNKAENLLREAEYCQDGLLIKIFSNLKIRVQTFVSNHQAKLTGICYGIALGTLILWLGSFWDESLEQWRADYNSLKEEVEICYLLGCPQKTVDALSRRLLKLIERKKINDY